MFGLMTTPRSSPPARTRPDVDRIILLPRAETTSPQHLEEPTAGSPRGRQAAREALAGLRIFAPESRTARARRLLGTELTYVAHPSFDDPAAHDAILAPAPEPVAIDDPGRSKPAAYRESYLAGDRDSPPLSREQEVHLFRQMNYQKCLAVRIRDRIDPHRPRAADLDEIERLQDEARKLRDRIVEANQRLVVSVARKRLRPGDRLSDRVSHGNFALLLAVDHFDFARGNRFSTYATWAIINELVRDERKERRRRARTVALHVDSLAAPDSETERYEQDEFRRDRRAKVERLLRRLDRRERRIIVNHLGIGGGPEETLRTIGRGLGISKERARQIEQRAYAKLREWARLESLDPSEV